MTTLVLNLSSLERMSLVSTSYSHREPTKSLSSTSRRTMWESGLLVTQDLRLCHSPLSSRQPQSSRTRRESCAEINFSSRSLSFKIGSFLRRQVRDLCLKTRSFWVWSTQLRKLKSTPRKTWSWRFHPNRPMVSTCKWDYVTNMIARDSAHRSETPRFLLRRQTKEEITI